MMHCWILLALLNAVAIIPAIADISYLTNQTYMFDEGFYGGYPNQTFRSTSIVGPLLEVSSFDPKAADKTPYILLTSGTYGSGSGVILLRSDDLSLVYTNSVYSQSHNADVQTYNGIDYLTVWSGYLIENNYAGHVQMYDSNYGMKYNFSTHGFNTNCDMHDFVLTDQGTAILFNYDKIYPYDLSFMKDGRVDDELRDSCFQELDVATQEVLFTWRLSDHWSINDTYVTIENYGHRKEGGGFDFGHINSVQKTPQGNYLVSFRHLCAVLMIHGETGDIIWHLGGSHNDFEDLSDGHATDFRFQHDARFPLLHQNGNNTTYMTLFDNAAIFESNMNQTGYNASRVMHLELDYEAMTVKLVGEDRHPDGLLVQAMGGASYLPDTGNTLVAWGYQPSISEHAPDGSTVLDIQFGPYDWYRRAPQVYRAKKVNWTGKPRWPPSIASSLRLSPDDSSAASPKGEDEGVRGVYLSWNGATEYTQWAVLASDSVHDLNGGDKLVSGKFFPRQGFETFVSLNKRGRKRYVRAAALDAAGRILGSTDVVDMHFGKLILNEGFPVTDVSGGRPGGNSESDDNDSDDDGDDDDLDGGIAGMKGVPSGLMMAMLGLVVVLL